MTRRLSLLVSFAQTLIHVVRLAAAIAVEERDTTEGGNDD